MAKLQGTVVIGRFQPFHKGHLSLVQRAMKYAPQTFILLGSHNRTRTSQNVWTTEERIGMMAPCFSPEERQRLHFLPIDDWDDDKKWVAHVRQQLLPFFKEEDYKAGLVGYFKDASSYYLKLFHPWSLIPAPKFCEGLSATDLRRAYFDGMPPNPTYLADPVVEFLCDFRKTAAYKEMKELLNHSKQAGHSHYEIA